MSLAINRKLTLFQTLKRYILAFLVNIRIIIIIEIIVLVSISKFKMAMQIYDVRVIGFIIRDITHRR